MTEKGLVAAKNAAELLGTQLDHLVEAITTRATKIPGTHLIKYIKKESHDMNLQRLFT